MSSEKNSTEEGRLVDIGDTKLFIVERGSGFPVLVLHGGPGLDHHEFADYLDPLTDQFKLILVDQRSQGLSDLSDPKTWTLPQMAKDVGLLAKALNLDKYAVLGHSYGAFVAVQHAVDYPGEASKTIISSGVPATKYLAEVEKHLKNIQPIELREQIVQSLENEKTAETQEDFKKIMDDQMPFHFKEPKGPIIEEYMKKTADTVYSPKILKHFSQEEYGGIDVEGQLSKITQPTLVLSGRYDRVCDVKASEAMGKKIPNAQLEIFENSAHMSFAEENEKYLRIVRSFLMN